MSLFQAIILAIVQGLTEFLPISSTAHLVLFPWLPHWPDPGQEFDVALHAGTLLAVLVFFIRDWMELTLAGLGFNYRGRGENTVQHNRKFFWYLVAGDDSRRDRWISFRAQNRRTSAPTRLYRRSDDRHRIADVVRRICRAGWIAAWIAWDLATRW